MSAILHAEYTNLERLVVMGKIEGKIDRDRERTAGSPAVRRFPLTSQRRSQSGEGSHQVEKNNYLRSVAMRKRL